jgi:Cd2+/Zn2+-exporting ATPase
MPSADQARGAEAPVQARRIDLPLLLPEVPDVRDACVARLVGMLERRDGVLSAHVAMPGEEAHDGHRGPSPDGVPALCLHYDPERLSLTQVENLARAAGAEVTERYAHVVVPFRLVGTEDDGQRLERTLSAVRGVTSASVSLPAQLARVEFDRTAVSLDTITRRLADAGASLTQEAPPTTVATSPGAAAEAAARPSWYARNHELAWSLTSGVLLAAAWLLERGMGLGPVVIGLYVLSYFFGARDNVSHFVKDLRGGHFHFNIDLLMVVAAIGAAILGEWVEGALLLFLFSLGHAAEHYALGRARNAIKALAELAPTRAIVLRDEGGVKREVTVAIEEVRKGDRVVVKPAERIPVDGKVLEGRSGVNQAPITGESVPVDKVPGEPVFAGSVNGEGALVVEVTAAIGDRTLDRVVKLVAEAQTQKAPTQQFTDRFERIFVPAVLVADALLIVVPPLMGVWTWSESFYRAMALLVAASPCALALGTPAAVLAGIAQAARRGVLIKGGAHLEALGSITVLALDKTGTITKGEPAVTDIVPAPGVSEDVLLATTAAIERRSQHPLARAITTAADARRLTVPEAGEVQSVTGRGIRAPVGDATVEVGRALMFEEGGVAVPADIMATVARLEENGRSTMVVRQSRTGMPASDGWLGVIGIADEPRENAKATLVRLRQAGIQRIVMLTGDNAGVGNAVGRAVGVDDVRAGLLPEDKVTAIRELAAAGPVAMIGDGVNDAPALANATVGIAMGGAGTAAALETADVALMSDDLGQLPFAIGLSRQARAVIRQNLYVSLGVIMALVVVTVTGVAGIGPAVIAHEGSTLVVIANALRLLAYRGRDT